MTNPLYPVSSPPPDIQEIDPEITPKLTCKFCNQSVQKSPIDGQWTHEDEEIEVNVNTMQILLDNKYDHVAWPDFIDTKVKE